MGFKLLRVSFPSVGGTWVQRLRAVQHGGLLLVEFIHHDIQSLMQKSNINCLSEVTGQHKLHQQY